MRDQRATQISATAAAVPAGGRRAPGNGSRARRSGAVLRLIVATVLLVVPLAPAFAQSAEELDALHGAFEQLRIFVYVAVGGGLLAGIGVFLFRRQRLMRYSVPGGLAVAVLGAVLLLWALGAVFVSDDASRCIDAPLRSGAAAQSYDLACAEARDRFANALGLVSVARSFEDERRADLPLGPRATRVWPLLSAALAALLGFLLLRPLFQRLFVRV